MSQVPKITYDDKTNPIPVVNRPTQATAEDFNEIKSVLNQAVDGVNYIKSNDAVLLAGNQKVTFLAPYASGVPYNIVVLTCLNSAGRWVGYTVTSKDETGFYITVDEDCTLVYLAVPKR